MVLKRIRISLLLVVPIIKRILEKALVSRPGRFDKVIDFPLPEYEERLKMLKDI
jgi:ATP-dependent 26S proteasome regulatory subunit